MGILAGKNYGQIGLTADLVFLFQNCYFTEPVKVYSAAGTGIINTFEGETGILASTFAEDEIAIVDVYNPQGSIVDSIGNGYSFIKSGQTGSGALIATIFVNKSMWGNADVRSFFAAASIYRLRTVRVSDFAL